MYNKRFWVLFVAHVCFCFQMSTITVLSLWVEKLGGNKTMMGFVAAILSIGSLLIRPFWGAIIDNRGRKTSFFIGGVIIFGTFLGYSQIPSLNVFFMINTCFFGIAFGGLFATYFTYMNDICPREKLAEGLALFGISGFIGMGIGPGVVEWVAKEYSFVFLFKLLMYFSLVSLFMTMTLAETVTTKSQRAKFSLQNFSVIIKNPIVYSFWVVAFAFGCGLSCNRTFLAPLSKQYGIESITYFFASYAISSITLRLLAADLPDRIGRTKVLIPSIALFACGQMVIGLFPYSWGLIIAGILGGIGHGYIFPILNVLITEHSGNENRGMATSCFIMFMDLGGILGTIGMGYIAEEFGFLTIFRLMFILTCASFLFIYRDKKSKV